MASELSSRGYQVAITYREQEGKAIELANQINSAGGRCLAVRCDVSHEGDVRRAVAEANEELGPIDLVVANAGTTRDNLLGAMSVEDWDIVLNTNLRGTFLCIREVLPEMMRRRSGSVVAISSVAATLAGRGHANYVASKAGLEAMIRSLAVELAPRKIRVNAVAPGIIDTDMTTRIRAFESEQLLKLIPLRRFGAPADVAKVVAFLASPDASYITGAVLPVTGGLGL